VTSLCEGKQREAAYCSIYGECIGKYDGNILRRLCANVHEMLGQRGEPFAVSNAIPGCLCDVSMTCLLPKIFAIKSRSGRKNNKCMKLFGPNFFFGGDGYTNFSTAERWRNLLSIAGKVCLSFVC